MHIQSLGHAVLKVRNLERSVAFYRDVLGLPEIGRYRGTMTFFSLGKTHHDLALLEVGAQAPSPDPHGVGLYHLAFKVGDSLDDLRACKAHLEQHGIAILGSADHGVSQSLYLRDPDSIEIELYVDADPAIWRDDPMKVMTVKPLRM